jgi:hypothetical protein
VPTCLQVKYIPGAGCDGLVDGAMARGGRGQPPAAAGAPQAGA